MFSCKLTLVMPNATKRTFETAASYSDQRAARMRAFLDARESGTLEAARKLREELGWQVEEQEAAEEREKVRSLKGGEKPWETLRAEQEKWMAPPINARLDKDELSECRGSPRCRRKLLADKGVATVPNLLRRVLYSQTRCTDAHSPCRAASARRP